MRFLYRLVVCRDTCWKANDEGRSLADVALHPNGPAMFIHHDRPGNGKPLTRSFSDLLRSKKRIEDLMAYRFWDPSSGISNADLDRVIHATWLRS